MIHWIICLVRYRRVERYCDKCERQLLHQLNNTNTTVNANDSRITSNLSLCETKLQLKETQNHDLLPNECMSTSTEEKSNRAENLQQIEPSRTPQKIGCKLRIWRRLGWRQFSRNWGRFANTHFYPEFINTFLIWWYANSFGCNLDESEKNWKEYKTLGQFFTRKLKSGIRPICPNAELVSPADGTLTHIGQFKGGFLEQVKGSHYSINYFLGLQRSNKFNLNKTESLHASTTEKAITSSLLHNKDGSTVLMQMIVYLGPGDYHRFHSPADWSVQSRRYL